MSATKKCSLAFAYVLMLHLVVMVLVVKAGIAPKITNRVGMIMVHEQLDALARKHPGMVLLGDSHTQHLGGALRLTNLGVSGEVTAGVLQNLPNYHLESASAISLMIGTNDIWRGKVPGLPERLRAIERALPAGVPLVWSAIPPSDDFRIDADDVRDANRVICALCAAHGRCTYINTWALLADKSGHPILRYFREDHVHLSADGYHVWLAALGAALDRLS